VSASSLLWFRNDLRLHDHAPLYSASQSGKVVIPLYCLDPRQFGTTKFGFPKTGVWRSQFLEQSLRELRHSLEQLGASLVVRKGLPEAVIPELVRLYQVSDIYYHQEVTAEEIAVEQNLQQALPPDVKLHTFWGSTLLHPEDLPFAIAELPELFTNFRKQVEKYTPVRAILPTPSQLPPLPPDLDIGAIPDLGQADADPRAVLVFRGGETAGQQRLEDYFWKGDRLKTYKQTRNGMLGADYSSKFSPWLALGCLSPRYVYWQVKRYEQERIANDSTYWLIFELLWRDYFRFICAKHGNRVFQPAGLQGIPIPWRQDGELFELWRSGRTGYPLVDANMRELALTGFMSNRGRQNVASFLTKNLGIDWRMGAEWFESCLIDYDVCSNYGNWNYTAGVGNDARGFRFFHITKQAQDYDPEGQYVKHWLPELTKVPKTKIHQPWLLLPVEQERIGLKMGREYPLPIVDLMASAKENEAIYTSAVQCKP
jgi:deoxyribodipyrimidine photo-lyase